MFNNCYSKEELIQLFKSIGIVRGMCVVVHVSMKKFGYIIGGAQTFNDALIECLGDEGTLIMPLQCSENSDPASWDNPCVPFNVIDKIRNNYPAFDENNSDSYYMGRVVDNLRRRPGVVFSKHPNMSFIAYGQMAEYICNHHLLELGLGENSPLASLYNLKASTVLMGVDYDNATVLHLAEYRSGFRPYIVQSASVIADGKKQRVKYLEEDLNSDDFIDLGFQLEKNNLVKKYQINDLIIKVFKCDEVVNFGQKYFEQPLNYYK